VDGDITVSGGTLSTLVQDQNNPLVYTATFTPTAGSTTAGVIRVDSAKFTDAAGNANADGADTNNEVSITVDTVPPTIAITTDDTALNIGDTATITFTLSEASSDLVDGDITVSGGTLSTLVQDQNNPLVYTATFTPTAGSTTAGVIRVDSAKFTDAAGNANADGADTNNEVSITVDTVPPTIAITTDDTALNIGDTATITFTLSEASSDLVDGDITVSGGTLSTLVQDQNNPLVYTATFTPTAGSTTAGVIRVDSAKFTDAAGNANADGADTNNEVSITVDTVPPTIAITTDDTALNIGDTATITFTLSEASSDLVDGDITVSGGTLSTLVQDQNNPLVYTATFTPTAGSTTAGVIRVDSAKFTDAAGNANADGADTNNEVSITVDTVPPTIAITTDDTALNIGDTATITFTLSEASSDLVDGDITVSGGTLSTLVQDQNNPLVYTATFTPTAGSTTAGVIRVDSAKFTDAAGNANADGADTNNEVSITVDTVPPTIAITTDDTALNIGDTATITFTLSEASSDLVDGDITVSGGTLSTLVQDQNNPLVYTATFTPTAGSTTAGVIRVDSAKFTDAAGNANADGADTNNEVSITVDTVPPTIAITTDDTALNIGDTATITFTLSEASSDLVDGDITVSGGTLSTLVQDQNNPLVYTATFTPTAGSTTAGVIRVDSAKFTDAAGNANADGADTNNEVSITVDTVPPTIAITTDDTALNIGDTATITFTLSEASSDLVDGDITVSGGTLSTLVQDQNNPLVYTATFTPTAGSTTAGVIRVDSAKFTDAAGNANADGADTNNEVSITVDTVPPTIAITTDDTALNIGDTATITFTLSEASSDLVDGDITVSGGTLSTLVQDQNNPLVYTATFTPTAGSTTAGVIRVDSAKFTDAAGNANADGADTNNEVSITVDTVPPTIAITTDDTALNIGDTATITFTLSEASSDLVDGDITVSGGTLSTLVQDQNNPLVYTATFTPTAGSTTAGVIRVDSAKFTDAAGNANADGADTNNEVSITVDTVPPTIAITTDDTALNIGDTATITFTLSEASSDLVDGDITVSGGTLSTLVQDQNNPLVYTATFTPTAGSTTAGVIRVDSAKFTDAAGNANADGADTNNEVSITVDTVPPTIAITTDDTALNIGDTATITFTLSEASSDLVDGDITVSGGTLSTLVQDQNNPLVYTATFTPTAGSTTAGVIRVDSAKFTDAAGNANADGADTNNEVSITVDTVPPTIAITTDDTALNIGDTATITFTLSEASSDLVDGDITVSGGTLSTLVQDQNNPLVYTATFTPTAGSTTAGVIRVDSAKFTDAAGNANADGADTNNEVSITVDTVPPTIAITTDDTALNIGDTATITFTLSEASSDLVDGDITVSGGTLSTLVQDQNNPLVYTATFTPTAGSTTAGVIRVDSAKFTDAAGNANADGADTNNEVSITVDTVPPTIAITTDDTALNIGDTATITFTLSEASSDLVDGDITVSGGTLSTLVQDQNNPLVYTATFTPTAGSTTAGVIRVDSAKFTDAAGNANADGADTNNEVSITVDTVTPPPSNSLPVAVDDSYTVAEDGTIILIPLTADTDVDSDPLSVVSINGTILTPGAAQVISVTNGTVNVSATGVITFTPNSNFNGTVTVPYVISDGTTTSTANEVITVTPVNDAPVDPNDTNTVTEDTTLTVVAADGLLKQATDPEGDTLTITGYTVPGLTGPQAVGSPVTIPNVGVLTINANGSYSFVPEANYTEDIPVATYTISDSNGGTDTSTLTLTMVPVNDVFVDANESVTSPEDTVKTGNVIDVGLTSGDGPITVAGFIVDGILDANNQIPTFTAGQTVSISGIGSIKIESNGSYIFTPVANWNGTVPTITYSLTDSFGIEEISTLDIVVDPVNDAPSDENESKQTEKNVTLSIPVASGLLENATDGDGGTLTIAGYTIAGIAGVQQIGSPVDILGVGAITINADGSYVFVPVNDYTGPAPVITYTVSDGQGGVDTSTLTITIKADENLPPLPRKDVFGHHYFQRRFEEKPIEMGRYEFNEIVLDFNGAHGGINQFRPPMTDTTGTRDALDYSNVTPYNKFDRVADEIEIAKRSLDLGLAILKLPDYELRNILPLADVKVPANGNVEYRLPAATFKGGKGDLKLVAVLKDGSPLPGWLKFNPKTGLFEGVVPPDHVGPIDLKVIATDDVGGQADVKLTIKPEASKAVLKGKPSFTAQLKSAIGLGK
jgi:large repetitive protein